MRISSYLLGEWQDNGKDAATVHCTLDGSELGSVAGYATDLGKAMAYARENGGPALRGLSYSERGQLLRQIAGVLKENQDKYAELSYKNNGATDVDTFLDVEGGIGTVKYYASLAKGLGDRHWITDGTPEQLTKDENFRAIHVMTPIRGVAVHINAFNFPAWGMLEKLAVALLSGVPMLIKPATSTLPVAYEMVKDIIDADILPAGVLSLLAGGGRDLLDHITSQDAVAFTGSADTAALLTSHPRIISEHVRFNAEADSINSSILGPDSSSDATSLKSFVHEVTKEMTIKAGQKCTAIRRIFVPEALLDTVQAQLIAKLSKGKAGDPKREGVTYGPLVSASQKQAAIEGTAKLAAECEIVFEGNAGEIDGDENGYFVTQKLMLCRNPEDAELVHSTEVFGPVATLMPYKDTQQLFQLVRLGGGSLVTSIFTNDDDFAIQSVTELGASHGRLLIVDDSIARSHSGHGNVMPMCNHGGPGRAGGGQELGGLRGLAFYHVRTAIQTNANRANRLVGDEQ